MDTLMAMRTAMSMDTGMESVAGFWPGQGRWLVRVISYKTEKDYR